MTTANPITFRQVQDDYVLALEWIASFGISFEETRAKKYLTVIEEFVLGFEAEEFSDLNTRSREIFISLFEASDISLAHQFLKDQCGDGFVERLSAFVGGPDSYSEEITNNLNHSRNIGFELAVASRFISAGVEVGFDTTADVHLRALGKDFFVQCKRPARSRNVVRNLNRANTQLRRDYTLSEVGSRFGIIAIDATRIINPEFEVLVAQNQEELATLMSSSIGNFVNTSLRQSRFKPDPEVLGVVVRYTSLGLDRELGSYTFSQRLGAFPFHGQDTAEGVLFDQLAELLSPPDASNKI